MEIFPIQAQKVVFKIGPEGSERSAWHSGAKQRGSEAAADV